MPQGARKKQPKNPNLKQKSQKKPTGLKKGRLDIAPKKGKHIEEQKWKKNISKVINSNLEKEIKSRASTLENKSFKVVDVGPQGKASKNDDQKK